MKTFKPWYIAQMSNGVVQWAGIADANTAYYRTHRQRISYG
ncbi:hypothetical protein JCM19235_1038 [Vibrio maritimus]|uniref:Uncharacterized protein n=1 Tax=Vibrio maritimus TaxID=990268 RepID=A0A090SJS2_9VIBR|nr:hypothetical protein JCM19235_1038 [Vibrio maritimus]